MRVHEAKTDKFLATNETVFLIPVCQRNMDSSKIKWYLKLNPADISGMAAALERFNYRIIGRCQETPLESSDKERLGLLFNYLNI